MCVACCVFGCVVGVASSQFVSCVAYCWLCSLLIVVCCGKCVWLFGVSCCGVLMLVVLVLFVYRRLLVLFGVVLRCVVFVVVRDARCYLLCSGCNVGVVGYCLFFGVSVVVGCWCCYLFLLSVFVWLRIVVVIVWCCLLVTSVVFMHLKLVVVVVCYCCTLFVVVRYCRCLVLVCGVGVACCCWLLFVIGVCCGCCLLLVVGGGCSCSHCLVL